MSLLLIRVDGGSEMGAGHVMRCLALAQAWREAGGDTRFVSAVLDAGLMRRLEHEEFAVTTLDSERGSADDAAATREVVRTTGAEWLALDGYCFDATYQRNVAVGPSRTLMIDDTGESSPYSVDVLVNQNLHASEGMYRDAPGARLLLGPQYILLRDEFLAHAAGSRIVAPVAHNILVTLGGSDPGGHTLTVLRAVRQLADPDMRCITVVGASNVRAAEIAELAAPDPRIEIRTAVDDMAPLMAWADLAVSSGGSTVWELAYMGVPTIVGSVAAVEVSLARGLVTYGLFTYLGSFDDIHSDDLALAIEGLACNAATREEMGHRGNSVVDGEGCQRVVSAMNAVAQTEAAPSQKVSE